MFCGNCGKQIPDHAVYCPLCGLRTDGTDNAARAPAAAAVAAARPVRTGGRKRAVILAVAAFVLVAALAVGGVLVLNDFQEQYADAAELLEAGQYEKAKRAFEDIALYKDSRTRAKEAGYQIALQLLEEREYLRAQAAFTALGQYLDSWEQAVAAGKMELCANAQKRIDDALFEDALAMLTPVAGFAEADRLILECNNGIAYREADALMQAGDYQRARAAFEALDGYSDAASQAKTCGYALDYQQAVSLMTDRDMSAAAELLEPLAGRGFWDAAEQLTLCRQWIAYTDAQAAYDAKRFYTAYAGFDSLGDFEDAAELAAQCPQDAPAAGAVYENPGYSTRNIPLTVYNGTPQAEYMKFYIGDTLVSTMYIPANAHATIRLPKGVYTMREGYGSTWYGQEEMFGPEGQYLECLFGGDSATYELNSTAGYEMRTVTGSGNVDYADVPWGDF